jgi:hypothetical protein
MLKSIKIFLVISLILALVLDFSFAFAKTEAVDCFDYYKFGSVKVPIQGETSSVVPGQNLLISGLIINENPYPVVDGSVFVKVFRLNSDKELNYYHGGNLVDKFFAVEKVQVDANATKKLNFYWKVPTNALPGDYEIAVFFMVSKKFNLLGLPFTDDVIGNKFRFAVKSDNTGVYLDKNSVKLNGENHKFIKFPPKFGKNEDIKVESFLVNETDKNAEVIVKWKLYSWDSTSKDNLIYEKIEKIRLAPLSKLKLVHLINDKSNPVNVLSLEAQYLDTYSILEIRFVREELKNARINFVSFDKFPIDANKQGGVFACIHSTGSDEFIENGRFEMLVYDYDGKKIGELSYSGKITGDIMGFKSEIVQEKRISVAKILANLYVNEKLVDTANLNYDCSEINPEKCVLPKKKEPLGKVVTEKDYTKIILFAVLAIVSIIGLVFLVFKKFKGEVVNVLLFFVLVSIILVVMPENAQAAKTGLGTIKWEKTETKPFYYWDDSLPTTALLISRSGYKWGGLLEVGLKNARFGVSYGAQVINKDTGKILQNNEAVPIGSTLLFKFLPREDTDIEWSGIGYSFDSPYGVWIKNADPPENGNITCDEEYYIGKNQYAVADNVTALRKIYIALSINPPNVRIEQNGTANLDCKKISEDEYECKVTSGGTIKPVFIFSDTHGKLYYRFYYTERNIELIRPREHKYAPTDCYGNNIPLYVFKKRDSELAYNSYFLQLISLVTGFSEPDYENFRNLNNIMLNYKNRAINDPFILEVPEQRIEFNLNANQLVENLPPNKPIIKGPIKGHVGTEYGFSVVGTHPQEKKIRFGVDFDEDKIADQWLPEEYVPSNTEVNFPKRWGTKGEKTIYAIAIDETGLKSDWAEHKINLVEPLSVDAGPDIVEYFRKPVFFNGSATGGTEPYTNWEWEIIENGADCNIKNDKDQKNAVLNCNSLGETIVKLTVTDSDNVKASDYAKATIISSPQCSIRGTSEIKTGIKTFEVVYSGFKENPGLNNDSKMHCNGKESTLSCTSTNNVPPFEGKCTANCEFTDSGKFEVSATIKNDSQLINCKKTEVTVIKEPLAKKTVVRIEALDDEAEEPDNDNRIVNDAGRFKIWRETDDNTKELVVNLSISGTATNRIDYAELGNNIIIPANSNEAYLDVIPLHDIENENIETIILSVVNNSNYETDASKNSAIVRIKDNDNVGATPNCEIQELVFTDPNSPSREIELRNVNYSNLTREQLLNGTAILDFGDGSPTENYLNLPTNFIAQHTYGYAKDNYEAKLSLYLNGTKFAECTKTIGFQNIDVGPYSVAINISTDQKYYKIDNVDTIMIDVHGIRKNGKIGKIFYKVTATRISDNYTEEIKNSEEIVFNLSERIPESLHQRIPWKINNLPKGIWIITARITNVFDHANKDVTNEEKPKTDNIDSVNVLIYEVKSVEAPEINPLLILAIAIGVLFVLRKNK